MQPVPKISIFSFFILLPTTDFRIEICQELYEVDQVVGLAASGFTNQYALFIYLVVSRLKAGGRAAFIVPSEFLATGCGEQVKKFICRNRQVTWYCLIRLERVFPDALGCCSFR